MFNISKCLLAYARDFTQNTNIPATPYDFIAIPIVLGQSISNIAANSWPGDLGRGRESVLGDRGSNRWERFHLDVDYS